MKGFLAALILAAAWIFTPTTAFTVQAGCPSYPMENVETIGGACWFELERPLTGSTQNGSPTRAGAMDPKPDYGIDAEDDRSIEESGREQYHTVRRGESLSKIAKAYGTSVGLLVMANPQIINPSLIHVNDQIRIPSSAEQERLRIEYKQRRVEAQQKIVESTPHNGERWVDVDLQTQTVRVYEGDSLVNTFVASTGIAKYPTLPGRFRIWLKLKTDDMKGPGYHLKDVPYVMYFYEDYALHGTYWHSNFGTPMSHGCVNLRTDDAAWLFDFSYEGMQVNVH